MKKQLILGSILAIAGIANAQWTSSGSDVYKTTTAGNVGIGNTGPANKLDLTTNGPDDGIRITQNGNTAAMLYLNNVSSGGHNWALHSSGSANSNGTGNFSIYDLSASGGAASRMFMSGTSGNVGFGTITPGRKITLVTNTAIDDGVQVTQNGAGQAGYFINKVNAFCWAMHSGGGNFYIKGSYNGVGGSPQLEIDPSYGNIGMGIVPTTSTYKLEMIAKNNGIPDGIKITSNFASSSPAVSLNNIGSGAKNFEMSSDQGGFFRIKNATNGIDGITMDANGNVALGSLIPSAKLDINTSNSTGALHVVNTSNTCFGLRSDAFGSTTTSGLSFGIRSNALNAQTNYGGYFVGYGDGLSSCANGVTSYGIYATVANPCANDYAGLFDGNVKINGAAYVTSGAWSGSDKKLKKDIKPLTSGLDKIKLLKPSTYDFRVDEFKGMNLPKEHQMGLIAQELEEVFPTLVSEVAGHKQLDDEGKVINTIPSYKAVNYVGLIPVLISGIQEQQKTIELQSQINTDLQKQLDEQKQLINSLSQKVSGSTGINSVGTVETGFQMSQNEPNPFTHETVVNYTMPQSVANAFMAVYDLTGKQVASFPITEKGKASITITSEKLAAGIYIYSVVADGKVIDSKRMIVADK